MQIRRIDDLGRVVIPKELRRALRLASLDEVEMVLSDDDTILLRKHAPLTYGTGGDFVKIAIDALAKECRGDVLLVDGSGLIVAHTSRKSGKSLSIPESAEWASLQEKHPHHVLAHIEDVTGGFHGMLVLLGVKGQGPWWDDEAIKTKCEMTAAIITRIVSPEM